MASDPWLLNESKEAEEPCDQNTPAHFENNFKLYEKLPDSAAYISSLEMKLNKLQGKRTEAKASDIVNSLESVRGHHMREFISDTTNSLSSYEVTEPLDRSSAPNCVLRRLRPDRQALSAEELQNLIIADELAKIAAELKEAIAAAGDEEEVESET